MPPLPRHSRWCHEAGKSCNQRYLQKLEMPDGHSQFVQSPLPICDLGAEHILIMIVLRIARQILIGIDGHCGSR
jgi:hypothetical protein